MPTLIAAASSDIQYRLDTDLVDRVTPELAFLFPRFVRRKDPGRPEWIGLMCRDPRYPVSHPLDPPKAYILVGYHFGERHEWLLWANRNRGDWTRRRVDLLLRLLLKRLALEVRKCSPTKQ